LERILETGGIFMAWSDRPWLLEGAAVRVSMVGFDGGIQEDRSLDGEPVERIHANLTSETETTSASQLEENAGISFVGPSPHGRFDIESEIARKMLSAPTNVNGRPNSDVVKRVENAIDLLRRPRNVWTIDFGAETTVEEAAMYELPFQLIRRVVYPVREKNHREAYRDKWWIYGEARPGMRKALANLSRFVVCPRVSKHRVFVWRPISVLCNDATIVFARADDYFFGVLHSTIHEVWSLHMGTQLENRPRYTPESTFLTFPFPWPPGTEPTEEADPRVKAIADAARSLVRLRDAWLNPPDIDPRELPRRTLTNLYNLRPEWLSNAHRKLDEAVFAAYGWPANLSKEEILARLLALNHDRAAAQSKG
jgi:type II restriction/modification system DNA methylase subunit YeeA